MRPLQPFLKFEQFVNENINTEDSINEAKPSADFGFGAKNLTDLKPGDFIWREMERHNPQLGIYYTLNKAKVAKVSGKKIWLDDYGTPNPNFYDRETGEQLKTSGSVYGSAYYTLMTHQQALAAVNADKDGKYKKDVDKVKSFKSQDAAEAVKESVNEGSVKSFEMAIDQLISDVKSGYGWIDPDYVFDSLEAIDDEINWRSFKDIKDEVYSRLIKAGILFYSDDTNPEQRGTKVTNLNQLGESVVNEETKGFVDATLLNDVKDLRKGSIVKIDALDFTRRGDSDNVTCIRPDGNKMEILKKSLTVKL